MARRGMLPMELSRRSPVRWPSRSAMPHSMANLVMHHSRVFRAPIVGERVASMLCNARVAISGRPVAERVIDVAESITLMPLSPRWRMLGFCANSRAPSSMSSQYLTCGFQPSTFRSSAVRAAHRWVAIPPWNRLSYCSFPGRMNERRWLVPPDMPSTFQPTMSVPSVCRRTLAACVGGMMSSESKNMVHGSATASSPALRAAAAPGVAH